MPNLSIKYAIYKLTQKFHKNKAKNTIIFILPFGFVSGIL